MRDAHHQTYSKSCKSYNKDMKMVLSYFMFNNNILHITIVVKNSPLVVSQIQLLAHGCFAALLYAVAHGAAHWRESQKHIQ